jgi:hypothetical protein
MNTVERVADTIRRNPESLLLLGAGVALMLRNAATSSTPPRQRKTRTKASSSDHYYDSAGIDNGGSTGSASEGLTSKVSAAADEVRSYVADTAQDLTDKASEYGHAATKRTKQAADSAYRSAEGVFEAHPMSMAIAGLAAGCLAAAVFPSTRFERDTLGPIGRRAADAVAETGAAVKTAAVERVSTAARKAGEQLTDAMVDGTLNTGTLGAVAREVASDFRTNVTGGESNANDDSRTGTRQPTARMAKAQL